MLDTGGMKTRTPVLVLAGVLLAGCSASPPAGGSDQAPATTPARPAARATPAPSMSPAPTPDAAAGPPAECVEASSGQSDHPVAAAAANAELPAEVSLAMGTQVTGSTDEPGYVEAVARVCSDRLDDDELLDVSIAVARAIYDDATAADALTLLKVSFWVPDGAGSVAQDRVAATDYEISLWDASDALLRTRWDVQPVP